MTISIASALNDARLDAVIDYLDTGSGNAKIVIYGGTRPANGAAPGSSSLATITLTKPCGSITSGVLNLTKSSTPLVSNTGVATWVRVVNGNGDHAFDCDASAAGGGAEVILSQTILYAGGEVDLLSAALG